MTDQIVVNGVSKAYQTTSGLVPALTTINLAVKRGEFLTVLGPSGCGKSTLLGIMGGMVPPDTGSVLIDGGSLTRPDPKKVALVFQDPGLFPWRSALENVEFGLELQGVPKAERRRAAQRLLEPVGLKGFEAKYPRELSGGMKQRVAIARALALQSPVLLMDEPFGALDEQTRLLMGEWLLSIWATMKTTIVFVTHSLQEAIALSSRIVVMSARPGRIKALFEVDLPSPRDLAAKEATELRAQLWGLIRGESLQAMAGSQ